MPFDQRVRKAFLDRSFAPLLVRSPSTCSSAIAAIAPSDLEQALRRVVTPVQDDILDRLAKLGRDFVINRQLARVDDAHIHSSL